MISAEAPEVRMRRTLLPVALAIAIAGSLAVFVSTAPAVSSSAVDVPSLPSWSEQLRVRDQWVAKRHLMLAGMMRRHDLDWWIVVTEEFHEDPLVPFVAPPRPYAGNRDMFVFIDAGVKGLVRVALTGYAEESLTGFFDSPGEPGAAEDRLRALYASYPPRRIGLAMSGRRGVARGLTHDGYRELVRILGKDAEARFASAGDLIEEYLDTRLPEEVPYFRDLVHLTEVLARRALSSEAITPGVTTVGDLRRFLYDALWEHRVSTWFQPDFRVQRRGHDGGTSRGFLAVSAESTVIERGDLVHLDFGISAMGFDTDWQKMAYVLREGENGVPAGLARALEDTHAVQDALMRAARPGRDASEVYRQAMAQMREEGIEARIYSHPLGNQGHGLGPAIDSRSAHLGPTRDRALRPHSWMSIELGTVRGVPEWDGQPAHVMQEDPAYLTDAGYRFFRPRQESFYLVR